jgi:hypothetical protein
MTIERVLVNQAQITEARVDSVAPRTLTEGQARLALDSFALTANNVTYAATGFVIGYWRFFPSGIEGQGIVPVWGVARVVESRSDALAQGTRLYGFWPMAQEAVITPEATPDGMIVDRAPHRADLPAVYNRYIPVRAGAVRDDHLRALLQPLLATSYLLFDWLGDNGWFGAEQIIIGSASSKTGLGLAKFLAELQDRPYRIVGLTSQANRDFVAGLGAYDQVLRYDQIDQVARVPSVYVDMAGNAEVKLRLHTHLGDAMRHSAAVGTSHWDKFAQPQNLPGAKPRFFFAPAQIEKRRADWGPGEIERRIAQGWKRLAASAGDWMSIREHHGLQAAAALHQDIAEGRANPRDGHVIIL